jgi:hypothetical protein
MRARLCGRLMLAARAGDLGRVGGGADVDLRRRDAVADQRLADGVGAAQRQRAGKVRSGTCARAGTAIEAARIARAMSLATMRTNEARPVFHFP